MHSVLFLAANFIVWHGGSLVAGVILLTLIAALVALVVYMVTYESYHNYKMFKLYGKDAII